jgi:hypothetical protein
MTYGGRPGKNGPWRRPGDKAGSVPPQWGYGQQDDTPVLGPPGQRPGAEPEQRAGGGLWQPPAWRYRQQPQEQGNGQREHGPGQPETRSLPTWPAPPGQPGFGPPSPPPPYRPPQPPFQPPFQPPQRGKSWPARHKALTGLLAFLALIIVIAAARSGGPSSPPGKGTTAGLTTTTSPTATQSPSHHATRAAATVGKTQSRKTQPAPPATSHGPTPSAPAAPSAPAPPTTPAAVIAPPPSAAPTSGPPSSAAPASCDPLTNSGKCYEPGEFCRTSDHGASGVAGDGEPITCENNGGWRWEPV